MGCESVINLRRAHLDDHWKTTFRRNYSASISKATYENGSILNGMSVNFKKGFNAFVGRNGIGKSNFIRSLYNIFISDDSNRAKFSMPLLAEGKVKIEMKINDVVSEVDFTFGNDPISIDGVVGFMFDPCTLIPSVQKLFVDQDNLEELLESYSPIRCSDDDLRLINFLTHGEYTEVLIVNIEDDFQNFPRLPFFIVKNGFANYDSRNMGLGELSLFYLYWLVEHMRKTIGNKILFIEEPESFLPPSTQERLSDVLAMTAATMDISIILSSHSEHILKRLPLSNVHIMRSTHDGTRCSMAADNSEPIKLLGLTAKKIGILLYEDYAAELLLKSLLKMSRRINQDNFYYCCSGSDGDILQDLLRFPNNILDFSFVGVFDGDCIGKYEGKLHDKKYCFLPSAVPPEVFLIDFVKRKTTLQLAIILGIGIQDVLAAQASAAGCDHHDYFLEFSKSLNKNLSDVLSRICEHWTNAPENKDAVAIFLSNLEGCCF
jgi:hypothetical protein